MTSAADDRRSKLLAVASSIGNWRTTTMKILCETDNDYSSNVGSNNVDVGACDEKNDGVSITTTTVTSASMAITPKPITLSKNSQSVATVSVLSRSALVTPTTVSDEIEEGKSTLSATAGKISEKDRTDKEEKKKAKAAAKV